MRAPKKCAREGCETRVTGRTYCDEHAIRWQTSTRPGSTRASRELRAAVLRRDRTCRCEGCQVCTPNGCTRPATEDDHIVNLASGGTDSAANHRGMCAACHRRKTLTEARRGRT